MRTQRTVAGAGELADVREHLGDDGHRVGRRRQQERVEQQHEMAVAARVLGERAQHGVAQGRRRHRLLRVAVRLPQGGEVRQVVVGVEQRPAERQHREVAAALRALPGG